MKKFKWVSRTCSIFLSMVLILGLFVSVGVSAEETESSDKSYKYDTEAKTITVYPTSDTDYTQNKGIQNAIDFIDNQTDKTGWTITVTEGTYYRFTVYANLTALTVKAADNDDVEIIVLNDDSAPAKANGTYPDNCGVNIRDVDKVTLDGLTFKVGKGVSSPWYAAAVGTYVETTSKCSNLTIKNCNYSGNDNYYGITFMEMENWEVENCTFDSFYAGICWMADNSVVSEVSISNNTFTNCIRAVDGYYGSGNNLNTNLGDFFFTNNTITGTTENNCKVLLSDDYGGSDRDGTGNVTISGNTLTNSSLLLFDINLTNNVLTDNEFNENSYVNEASETTDCVNLTVPLSTTDNQKGYWELSSSKTLNISGDDYSIGDNEIAIIKAAIQEANETGSHTLKLDFSSLYEDDASNYWYLVTYLKYGVYWVGTPNYSQEPEVTKSVTDTSSNITDENGTYSVYAGDTVNFGLSILGPDYLDIYTGTGGLEDATERGSYEIIVHDDMDSSLVLDKTSIEINVEGAPIDSDYYTLTTDTDDDCEFHIVIDLIALYEAELYGTEDYITITYSATVASDAVIGTYQNSTWLTYEYINDSDKSTVEVNVVEDPNAYSDPTPPDEPDGDTPEPDNKAVPTDTSDNTAMYIYTLMLLSSACGAYYVTKRRQTL